MAPHLRGRTDSSSGPASAPHCCWSVTRPWAEGWRGIGRCSVAWTSCVVRREARRQERSSGVCTRVQ